MRRPTLSLLCLLACLVGQAQEFPLSDFSPALRQHKRNSFTVARVADLGDCPMAYLADGPRLWIVTMQGLLLVENGQEDQILSHVFWEGLYPNSICMDATGTLYVGLRGGYAKVDVKTRQVMFFHFIL